MMDIIYRAKYSVFLFALLSNNGEGTQKTVLKNIKFE